MRGTYTYPLQNYIKYLGKSSIHLGGCGQLLIGLRSPIYDIPYFEELQPYQIK